MTRPTSSKWTRARQAQAERALSAPFDAYEHTWNDAGRLTLLPEAVRSRLTAVGVWEIGAPTVVHVGQTVEVAVALTLGGITRYGMGGGLYLPGVAPIKDRIDQQLAAQAEADAFADACAVAFLRAAEQFGIGAYLVDLPDDLADYDALQAALDCLIAEDDEAAAEQLDPPTPDPTPAQPPARPLTLDDIVGPPPAPPPAPTGNNWSTDELYRQTATLFQARQHFDNWLNDVAQTGGFMDGQIPSLAEMVDAAQAHYDKKMAEHWATVFDRTKGMFKGADEKTLKADYWSHIKRWLANKPLGFNEHMTVAKTVQIIQQLMVSESMP